MLLLALLLFQIQSPQEVYYAWGWHGGYYLTNEFATREAFRYSPFAAFPTCRFAHLTTNCRKFGSALASPFPKFAD